ncbi:MAG: pyridoxal phosphate-dependent aminotransferase [Cytophagaceae bacterium]|nr:pyridoxal phosphate-dependent aminotransferase [Cytophagaceae bacterium]MDW8456456.1 pyridoxal phosphate-dependent aminotransferase [Cytophagaceae bacterium]
MRHKILSEGAKELSYEIREIVKKAEQIQKHGRQIYWENIGDPVQKNNPVPAWMREIISSLTLDEKTYRYCHSKGIPETREFLAELNNKRGGAQITADDILFFNGLGDGIAKLYQFINSNLRVIGPSPAYSTHSSAEAAHANSTPITYKLDPDNHWYPDLDDLYNKVKYNPNVIGILIINPDNPTGMVYPLDALKRIVEIAREFKLLLISDEIYLNITYNGAKAYSLAEVIEDLPGISMKGISKEFPWPGSRCGWMEFYNRKKYPDFDKFCSALENAKMIEVCSTTLPQLAIPLIMGDPRYSLYRKELNEKIGLRSKKISSILSQVPELRFNETYGAFYNTIIFKDDVLSPSQTLPIDNISIKNMVESWVSEPGVDLDKRFVYYLLGAKGVCVVPISSFCSDLKGFRVTLLEEDEHTLEHVFTTIKNSIQEYLKS